MTTGPEGRTTVREATLPARANVGFWNEANHSSVSVGSWLVKKRPVGPLSFYGTKRGARDDESRGGGEKEGGSALGSTETGKGGERESAKRTAETL